jgi:hypothetical protein
MSRTDSTQYAYQRSKSTEAALHNLAQKIEGSLNQKEFVLGVFLDINGAFDNASFRTMDAASGEHGVVLTLRRWIDAMLRCQSVQVEIREISVRVLVNWRCPQGGVLSPLLWSIVVDYLLRKLHNSQYQAQGYADDVVLLQKGKFVSTLCNRMQSALNWSSSTIVLFTNNRKIGGFYNSSLLVDFW